MAVTMFSFEGEEKKKISLQKHVKENSPIGNIVKDNDWVEVPRAHDPLSEQFKNCSQNWFLRTQNSEE